MKYTVDEYEQLQDTTEPLEMDEFGCAFCWDKRKQKSKELFFFDAANNMRICNYCPHCGRKYDEV